MVLAAVGHTAVHVAAAGPFVLVGAVMVVEGAAIDVEAVDVDGDDVLLPHARTDTESTAKIPTAAKRRFIVQLSSVPLVVGRVERHDRGH